MSSLASFYKICASMTRNGAMALGRLGAKPAHPFYTPELKGANADLFDAVKLGSIQKASDALNRGASLESYLINGRNAFLLAAEGQDQALCDFLISRGASAEKRSSYGLSALQHAIEDQRVDISFISYLISRGAPLNIENDKDRAPLNMAISNLRLDCVRVLINAGASLEDAFGYGAPLASAIRIDNLPMVMALVEAGADCAQALSKSEGFESAASRQWTLSHHEQKELELASSQPSASTLKRARSL